MAKKVNVELDLTPFIGLFALLVCMLLMTAVWNHIAAISTDSASSTSDPNQPVPPESEKKVSLAVTVLPDYIEMSEDAKGLKVYISAGHVDTIRFAEITNYWKKKYPDRKDVILNTGAGVKYNMLIRVFDLLVSNGFPDVGVNTK